MEDWIETKIADRLGGRNFSRTSYKFEAIKRARLAWEQNQCGKKLQLLDFSIGEPRTAPSDRTIRALQEAASEPENGRYMDCGSPLYLDVARDYMSRTFGVSLNPDEILPSPGIKTALVYVAQALLNPGDILITTKPGYGVLPTHATYLGATIQALPLEAENHFLPRLEKLERFILELGEKERERLKILHVNYPNSPTGGCATHKFFSELVDLAKKNHLLILNDAAYAGLWDENLAPLSLLQIPGAKDVSLEFHSLSKAHSMTGWRVGWVAGNRTLIEAYRRVKDNSDSGVFFPIQKAAMSALINDSPRTLMSQLRKAASAIGSSLRKNGFSVPMTTHPFYLYCPAPRRLKADRYFLTAADFAQWLLENEGIATVPWDDVSPAIRFAMTFPGDIQTTAQELHHRLTKYDFLF